MASTTVRISEEARKTLRKLANATGRPMNQILEQSVRAYHDHWLLEKANQSYASLREDPDAWAAYQAETERWDRTLMDGLSKEPSQRPRGRRRRGSR